MAPAACPGGGGQPQITTFCGSACKSHSIFFIWLLITTQTWPSEFTAGQSDKEALCKLTAASKKTHKCSKSTGKLGHDVATQEYFAFQREQPVDFPVHFSVQDHIYEKTLLILQFCCCKWKYAPSHRPIGIYKDTKIYPNVTICSKFCPFCSPFVQFPGVLGLKVRKEAKSNSVLQ